MVSQASVEQSLNVQLGQGLAMTDSEILQSLADIYEHLRSIERRLFDVETIALALRDTLQSSELASQFQKNYREQASRTVPLREQTVREINAAIRNLRGRAA
jgi:hypothetical protein